jgi:hypothetical protein
MDMDREQSEKQYLLGLLTQKKKDERRLAELIDEIELWKKRLALAKDHGREDLISAAEGHLAELELAILDMKGKIAMLNRDISVARGEVADAHIDAERGMSRAETDALVQHLGQAAGTAEPDPLDFDAQKKAEQRSIKREIEDIEGDMALDALRKKLEGGE